MSEINALVNGVGPQGKGKSTTSAKSLGSESNGSESAAMEFAAILGGWLNPMLGQGQNSACESSDPAGKEANSGQKGIQGLEGLLASFRMSAGINQGSSSGQDLPGSDSVMKALTAEMMTLSQDNLQGDVTDSGIGSGQLQGAGSPLTELDQYRTLITSLLQDLNGEIQNVSLKPAQIQELLDQVHQGLNLSLESLGEPSKVQVPLNQGDESSDQLAMTKVLKDLEMSLQGQPVNSQEGLNRVADLLTRVVGLAGEGNIGEINPGLQDKLEGSLDSPKDESSPVNPKEQISPVSPKGHVSPENLGSNYTLPTTGLQTIPKNKQNSRDILNGSVLNPAQNIPSKIMQTQPKLEALVEGSRLMQTSVQAEVGQIGVESDKSKVSEGSSVINQTTGSDGITSSMVSSNPVSSGQNSAPVVIDNSRLNSDMPAWLQVAREVQDKVLHQRPEVRELDIQLHPAELGQIKISLTWDNGQVHMHLAASEATTGQVLQNHLSELREALSQSGIQCGMLQMGLSDSGQNFNQRQNPGFASQRRNQGKLDSGENNTNDKAIASVASVDVSEQGIRQNNRIDVTA